MPARTMKSMSFTIFIDGKRITVKHIYCKGKLCRVFVPHGAWIEPGITNEPSVAEAQSAGDTGNPSQ